MALETGFGLEEKGAAILEGLEWNRLRKGSAAEFEAGLTTKSIASETNKELSKLCGRLKSRRFQ